jgi:O-antigen/teichoic acid export membrane protein
MVVGDLVNVLTGFGGVVLVMCGRESDLARSVLLGAVLNAGLTGLLVPSYGITGAAIAAATALAASNVAMTWLAWRRLGVWAAVLSVPLRR